MESRAPFEGSPSSPGGLYGPHPTPSRAASGSVILSQQEAQSSHPTQAALPAQPRPHPERQHPLCPNTQLTPAPHPSAAESGSCSLLSPTGSRAGVTGAGQGRACPTPSSPQLHVLPPLGVELRLPEAQVAQGWAECMAQGSRSTADSCQVGDWCQFSIARQVAPRTGSFQVPTGAAIPLSRGDFLALPGSFSEALHLTLTGAARLEVSIVNAADFGGPEAELLAARPPGPPVLARGHLSPAQAQGQTDPDSLSPAVTLGNGLDLPKLPFPLVKGEGCGGIERDEAGTPVTPAGPWKPSANSSCVGGDDTGRTEGPEVNESKRILLQPQHLLWAAGKQFKVRSELPADLCPQTLDSD